MGAVTTLENQYLAVVEVEEESFELVKKPAFLELPFYPEDELFDTSKHDELVRAALAMYREFDKYNRLTAKFGTMRDEDIGLCLDGLVNEPVRNAEVHGNKFNLDKKVKVRCTYEEMDKPRIKVEVEDEGDGFDPSGIVRLSQEKKGVVSINDYRPKEEVPENSEMGIGIIKLIRYCDYVTWNEKGNVITSVKNLG